MFWNLTVIVLCSLLLLFLIWKETNRPVKTWLAARITASVFATSSLALLALPVTINQKHKTSDHKKVILLTEGFNSDSVQRILNDGMDEKIFTISKSIKAFNATYTTDITSLIEPYHNTKTIDVYGNGIDDNNLSLLRGSPIIFHPAVIKNTFTNIDWTQKITSGEPLLIQGSLANASSSQIKIILTGFNTTLDSVVIAAKETSYFQLTTIPKLLDKAVYHVIVISGKDTLEKEPIPFEVKPAKPLSILLLAANPDFENEFLKNWLAKNEYKFAARTVISSKKYDQQFVNISSASLNRINSLLLEKFDVIIADASELSALPASGISTIKNYVESKGVGLIVKTGNTIHSSSFYSTLFSLIEMKDSIEHIIKLSLGETSHTTLPLKIEQPVYIQNIAGTQALVKDQQMRIMVNSKLFGSGKIVLTTIGNTYTWQLAGNTTDYNSYWSYLLRKAAKKIHVEETWEVAPLLPQKNEEVHLKLQTSKLNIPQAQIGEDMIYMEQNYHLLYEWNALYWPVKLGWQPLLINGNVTGWLYINSNEDWKGIKAIDKINATKRYAADHQYTSSGDYITKKGIALEIPKIYFLILFLSCSGFLWLEKKFKGN